MCMGPEEKIDTMESQLHAAFANDIHIYRSRPTYLELAPRSVSKGSALKLLLDRTSKITMDDVIAFGDNYNDIELLKMAGRGVAVQNARHEVIAVADEVTLDSKADGVATMLKRLMNGNS
jgi:hydroxymethylpyrimidine pyrophosphatase-like HAD family hydrolase